MVSSDRPFLLWSVLAANLALSLVVGLAVLRDFPNSADEYSYYLSAETFAEGKLSVPSPDLPRFFDFTHVVNDGRFYGKYPPGWPALLAAGAFLKIPWVVNPLLGAATLAVMAALARRFFSPEVANYATLASLANPFFVFNSASYFSHTSCCLAVTVFLFCYFHWMENPGSRAAALGLGASGGLSFLIRPYTALLVLLPLLAGLAWITYRRRLTRPCLRSVPFMALPAVVLALAWCAYNDHLTGSPWVMPFYRYAPTDRPDLADTLGHLGARIRDHLVQRLVHLGYWLPLSPLFAVGILFVRDASLRRRVLPFVGVFAGLVAGYFFYWGSGINQYGPRYLYEAFSALVLITACVVHRFGRGAAIMLAGIFLMNLTTLGRAIQHHAKDVAGRMEVYDQARKERLQNAVVFMRTGSGSMPIGDLTRNGIHFDGPVLYVWDRGEENALLLRKLPGRRAYFFDFDPVSRTNRLIPWTRGPGGG